MKRRVFALAGLGCIIVAICWFGMIWSSTTDGNSANRNVSNNNNAPVARTVNLSTSEAARPPSDRADPVKMFEAVEATNVAINIWGKVIDQDARPLSGVKIKYDYTIEHGNLSGVAWSNQEVRTGEGLSDNNGLFSVHGLKGHTLTILNLEHEGYQFRRKGDMVYDFYGSTAAGRFIPEQRKPIVFTMVQKAQREPLVHVKGRLRLQGEGIPERWNLWDGEPDPNGELVVTFRREPAVLERPGRPVTWSAELQIGGGGILIASLDEDVRRAPENGYLPTLLYPQTEQKQGIPYWSFYIKTVNGNFGRIEVEFYPGDSGPTARCLITGDMNPRPGSRNLEPVEEE